jgi:hypothetical protein
MMKFDKSFEGNTIVAALAADLEAIADAQVAANTLIGFLEASLETSAQNSEFMYDKRVNLIRMAVAIEGALDEMWRIAAANFEPPPEGEDSGTAEDI